MMRASALAVAAALLVVASGAAQDASRAPDDAPFVVREVAPPPLPDGTSDGATGMPHLDLGADGRLRMSYVALRGRGAATLLLSTWSDDAWSQPLEIARGEDWFVNWADFPSVAALADGTLVAHWLERVGEGTYAYGVRFVLSRDGGTSWSEERWLHDDTSPTEHGFASFVALDDDTFGAVWLDGRDMESDGHGHAGAMRIGFRTVAKTGELGPERFLDRKTCECCSTALGVTGTSDAPRVLALYRDCTTENVRDIAFVEGAGDSWTEPRDVSSDGWVLPGCPVNGPRLAVDGERIVVAWFTGAGGGAGAVRVAEGRRVDGELAFDAPRDVDDGAPLGRVDVALDAGEVVVTWLEVEEGRGTWRARVLPERGPMSASVVIADVPADRSAGVLRMACDDEGIAVAWTDPATRSVRTARLDVAGE